MNRVSALVSAKWLAEKLSVGAKDLRILDSSWYLPATGRNARLEYLKKHIPGSLFFDIDESSDKTSKLDHMLPSPQDFENYAGNLGITNTTHIVVYDTNDTFGIFSSQRVWWTFRVFGHTQVSILNGGLSKWLSEGYGYESVSEMPKVVPETFKAHFLPHLVKSFADVEANLQTREFQLTDARAAGRFNGTSPEPRPEIKPGHIPGSISVPFMDIMDPESKTVKSPEELKKLLNNAGIDLDKPLAASCGSGVTACCIALAAYLTGKEDVAIYDGAWTEWFLRAKPEQMVNCPKD